MSEQTPSDVGQAAGALLSRFPKHSFTFPDEDRELETDPTTITMRQLTYGEEQQALQAAEANKTTFLSEAAMRSIVAADGKEVTWENDGKARLYSGMSNKVRELTMQAFAEIGLPKPESRKAFLASKKTTL
jgi:hypothetical protein